MSAIKNDGGPAFPGTAGEDGCGNQTRQTNSNGDTVWVDHNQGMTLLDYFAGLAINAKIIGTTSCGKYSLTAGNVDSFAEDAYMVARAMLREREKGKT